MTNVWRGNFAGTLSKLEKSTAQNRIEDRAAVYCEQVFRKSVGVSPVCRRNADEK